MSAGGLLNADMATLRAWLGAGVRWWLDELAGLVPRRWREARLGRLAFYGYDPERGTLALLPGGSGVAPRPDAPIAVVLPPELTLIRVIDYPAIATRDLAGLIDLDRDRIMPQGRDAVLAARVLDRDPDSGRMQVEVAGLPLVDAQALALALTRSPTAPPREPVRILASAPALPGLAPLDLLPALRRAGLIGFGDRPATPLWLTVGGLFLLNIGLLIWRDSAAVAELSATIDQQQPAVSVAHRIIARMRSQDRIAQDTAAARRSREPVALMARIDEALPAGTWLQRLSWQGHAVQLTGYHPPRTDVAGALRRAGLAVTRYGDSSDEAPTPLGEPFEVTVKLEN
jgi:general secretion pathway protein L